jgi:xanthine dehydrogenase small subunit
MRRSCARPRRPGAPCRLDAARGFTGAGESARGRGVPFLPRSADELADWYAAHPDATLIAGATDVGLWVTKQLRDLGPVRFMNRAATICAASP